MKLKITRVRPKPFTTTNGEEIEYTWYKALREGDNVTIEFGSRENYSLNQAIDINLEKTETTKGGFRYKEVIDSE